jgi:DNA-binding Lrp family transcriptional regulator
MFNPDCYLPSESFFFRYERALMDLSDENLWIWLMHRAGKNQDWIAEKLQVSQSAVSHRIRKIEDHFVVRVTGRTVSQTGRMRKI